MIKFTKLTIGVAVLSAFAWAAAAPGFAQNVQYPSANKPATSNFQGGQGQWQGNDQGNYPNYQGNQGDGQRGQNQWQGNNGNWRGNYPNSQGNAGDMGGSQRQWQGNNNQGNYPNYQQGGGGNRQGGPNQWQGNNDQGQWQGNPSANNNFQGRNRNYQGANSQGGPNQWQDNNQGNYPNYQQGRGGNWQDPNQWQGNNDQGQWQGNPSGNNYRGNNYQGANIESCPCQQGMNDSSNPGSSADGPQNLRNRARAVLQQGRESTE